MGNCSCRPRYLYHEVLVLSLLLSHEKIVYPRKFVHLTNFHLKQMCMQNNRRTASLVLVDQSTKAANIPKKI
jgi:hypothetical protein